MPRKLPKRTPDLLTPDRLTPGLLKSGEATRRNVLAGLAYTGLGTAVAHAQSGGNWWDGLPGFGRGTNNSDVREASERRERVPEVLNDVRTDITPWRSDQMVENIEAAIARYQLIVQRGGWPMVPSGRYAMA